MCCSLSSIKIILQLFCLLLACRFSISKYNVSNKDLEQCRKLQLISTGYVYKDFFHINTLTNNKIAPDEKIHLRFYVKAAMDAHILLSATDRPRRYDYVYEIVLGAGSNTFSTIRHQMGSIRVATNQDARLLSKFEPTPIEVILKKNGTLQVFIPDYQTEPLLQYHDKSPLDIHFLSFSTYGDISANWYYDCEFDGYSAEIVQEERILSPQQRLIANITTMAGGANKTMPMNLAYINFTPQILGLSYDQHHSLLKTRLNFVLSWEDERLRWQPKDYNNITSIMQPDLDIWTPSFLVLNGAKETLRHFNPYHKLHISSNGSVYMRATNAELITWCLNAARNWPNEYLHCELQFGLNEFSSASNDGLLQLHYIANEHTINTLSEWHFISLEVVSVIGNDSIGRLNHEGMMRATSGDIAIEFELARNNFFYKNVFLVPFCASHALLLLSFFLHGYRRGALILVVIVIIMMGLMYLTKHAPSHYIPNLMIAYQHILRIATFCYILHIYIIWLDLYPPRFDPPNWFMRLLYATPTRILLCIRSADSHVYMNTSEHPWHAVAKALNNISCVVISIYLIIVSVLLAQN